jgi:hypothetical protein
VAGVGEQDVWWFRECGLPLDSGGSVAVAGGVWLVFCTLGGRGFWGLGCGCGFGGCSRVVWDAAGVLFFGSSPACIVGSAGALGAVDAVGIGHGSLRAGGCDLICVAWATSPDLRDPSRVAR